MLEHAPMSGHHPTDFQGNIDEAIISSIKAQLPDAVVQVSGAGGHFNIDVTSTAFEGKSMLQNQRLVLSAIKHLINGSAPPVHAVDLLKTRTP